MKKNGESTDVYDLLTVSDLTEDLVMISEVIGIDNVKKLIKAFNGLSFYIPKIKRLDSFVRRYIRENRDKPVKEIAMDLNVTETHIKWLMKNS